MADYDINTNYPRHTGNPFYVHPGGAIPFTGLTQAMKGFKQEKQAKAESVRREGVKQNAIKLREEGKYNEVSKLLLKEDWLQDDFKKVDKYKNDAEIAEDVKFSAQYLSAKDPQQQKAVIGQLLASYAKNNRNTDSLYSAIIAHKNGNPEVIENLAKANLATYDKKAFDRLVKNEKDGPQYTPTDEGNFVEMAKEKWRKDNPEKVARGERTPPEVKMDAVIQRRRANVAEVRDIGMAKNSIKKADDAFTQLGLLAENKANMNEVVQLLSGPNAATTGPVAKWFPSFRENTIKLMQVQKRLGLDVVRKTTFGALSKGELDLAKEVGMPESLKGPALKQWAIDKRNALAKLENYIGQYAHYLSSGGSDMGWFEMQKLKRHSEATDVKRNKNGLITHYRYANGEVEEVN